MERKRSFGWVLAAAGFLWLAILLLVVGAASAQTGGFVFSERESGQPHGLYVRAWNTTGVAIAAGTVVMADTLATGSVPQIAIGKGFKTWSGATTDRYKVMGVLIDPAPPGYSWARVMVKGFVPNAKVMSGITGGSYLRPSLTAAGRLAAMAANEDSLNRYKQPIGIFQRYARTDSAVAYVWVDFTIR